MACALVACLLVLPFAASAAARPIATCIVSAAPGDVAAEMWRSPRFDCAAPAVAFGAGDFWVRSAALPPGAGLVPTVLRSGSLWHRRVTVGLRYADGAVRQFRLDDEMASGALRLGNMVEVPVPVRGVPLATVLWRIEAAANVRGIVDRPELVDTADATRTQVRLAALYAAFAALCLALIVFNAALWSALRHRFQLAYVAMASALLGYVATFSGAIGLAMPWLGNNLRLRLDYLFLTLAALAALRFGQAFFEPQGTAERPRRLAVVVAAAMLLSTAAVLVFPYAWLGLAHRLFTLSFVGFLVCAVDVLVRARHRRAPHFGLFALAWSSPLVFAGLRTAVSLRVLEPSFLLDNSTLIALAAEALLSAVAIAYRLRDLSQERDRARAGELMALRLADTDPLTGLLNRRALLREVIGGQGERTLLLVDLDHFKRVNDTLGHDGGDEVLRRFSRAMRAAAPGALLARLGGEEFGVVAPTSGAAPLDLAEALLAAVRAERMPFDLAVTASIGAATGPLADEGDWSRLYREADAALYLAKTAGRDRVRGLDARLVA